MEVTLHHRAPKFSIELLFHIELFLVMRETPVTAAPSWMPPKGFGTRELRRDVGYGTPKAARSIPWKSSELPTSIPIAP